MKNHISTYNKLRLPIIAFLYQFVMKLRIFFSKVSFYLKYLKYTIEFGERDDDIYVATYMKSGTTWMQMILYQLTTDGSMDFDHIYDVSPWIRYAASANIQPRQTASPRIIKTHDPYLRIPSSRKGRFIFIIRNGMDVAVSQFHHRKNYNDPDLTFEKNFKQFFVIESKDNWFIFNQKWLQNKNKHSILFLTYEDLKTDFDTCLNKIIDFLHLEVTDEQLQRVKERSSFQYMKQFEDKFGEVPPQKDRRKFDNFIRKGKTNEGDQYFSQEQQRIFNDQLKKYLGQYPGF
jgi:hypothetical protein